MTRDFYRKMKTNKIWKKYDKIVLANDLPAIIDINPDDYEFEMKFFSELDPADLKRIAKTENHNTVVVYSATNIEYGHDPKGCIFVEIAPSYVIYNGKRKRIGVRKDFTMHWEHAMNGSNNYPRFYKALRKSKSENWHLIVHGVFNKNDMDDVLREYNERIDWRDSFLCSNYDINANYENDPRYENMIKY